MNTIERKLPKANLDIGACGELLTPRHAPKLRCAVYRPQSIQDQRTEAISLSEQLMDEGAIGSRTTCKYSFVSWSRDTARPAARKLARCCRMQSTHRGDRNRATGLLLRAWLNRRETGRTCRRCLR